MSTQIIRDTVIGGILFGIFSYMTSIFDEDPYSLKITAYLWGIPLFFFYLIYVTWKKSKEAAMAFTFHAMLGTALTVVAMLMTLYIQFLNLRQIIIINILFLLLCIFFYFYFHVYEI